MQRNHNRQNGKPSPGYHTFMDYHPHELPGVLVPQTVYATPGQPDFQPLRNISISVRRRPGLRLSDALNYPNGSIPGLDDAMTYPQLSNRGMRVTLRILVRSTILLNAGYGNISYLFSGQATRDGAIQTLSIYLITHRMPIRVI